MEIVHHHLRVSSGRLDHRGVDREELLRVDGYIVLLGEVRSELGGPVDPLEVCREGAKTRLVWAKILVW